MANGEYTLAGDRALEWGWLWEMLPAGSGPVLDVGPIPTGETLRGIAARGYEVYGVGLEPPLAPMPGVFIQSDIRAVQNVFRWLRFPLVVNVSTVEHIGLAGRYGVERDEPDADLEAMAALRYLLTPDGRMICTIPVGVDAVIGYWHRVYGPQRLPLLLAGYTVVTERYYAKCDGQDEYRVCNKEVALATVPRHGPPNYYALGCYILRRADAPQ